ncbi:MAG: metallophosphoesterase [bacterium]
MTSDPVFTFCIVSDGHVNPEEDVSSSPWNSNRMANGRNRYVVHMLNQLKPDFVIHLGDLIHPVPSLPSYATAARLFHEIFKPLNCPLHLLPGNHDIGDKPSSWTPAEIVNDPFMRQFETHFGSTYSSFDFDDCHFVLLNSQLLNSGLQAEKDQAAWLAGDLEQNRNKRIFMFCHYPPFITSPDEPEHYDNLSEPGRSWLMELIDRYRVKALFSGHVHNYFYNRSNDTDFFVLPSITFFRHDYSELFKVGPAEEFGRNDLGRFGIFWVKIYKTHHAVHCMRTEGSTIKANTGEPLPEIQTHGFHPREISWSGLGIDMRYPWAEIIEMPYSGGLDEFYRKKARNDHPLCAMWEMGVKKLRLPIHDLLDPQVRDRVSALKQMGHTFYLFMYDIPSSRMIDILKQHADLIESLEIIIPWKSPETFLKPLKAIRDTVNLPIFLSKLQSSADAEKEGGRFKHFIKHGFQPSETGVIREYLSLKGATEAIDGFVFRIGRLSDPLTEIHRLSKEMTTLGKKTQFLVTLAKENPALCEEDDHTIADRVAEASTVAFSLPDTSIFIDTFIDMDRGYFPRHGLVDRRSNPRRAAHVYRQLNTILGPHSENLNIEGIETVGSGKCISLKSPGFAWILILPETEMDLSRLEIQALNDHLDSSPGTLFNLVSGERSGVQLDGSSQGPLAAEKKHHEFIIADPSLLCFVL